MNRVVADTNAILPALLFGGLPGVFLDLAYVRAFQLITSNILLNELEEKLLFKFKLSQDEARLIRARLLNCAILVEHDTVITHILEDPDDDRVLECALSGKADCIVSGDKHLLRLGAYRGIPTMTVRQYMDVAFGVP